LAHKATNLALNAQATADAKPLLAAREEGLVVAISKARGD